MKPISHYKFRKAISLALIHPEQYWPDQMKTSTQDNNISVGDVTCIAASKRSCDGTTNSSTPSLKKNEVNEIDKQNTLHMHWVTSPQKVPHWNKRHFRIMEMYFLGCVLSFTPSQFSLWSRESGE